MGKMESTGRGSETQVQVRNSPWLDMTTSSGFENSIGDRCGFYGSNHVMYADDVRSGEDGGGDAGQRSVKAPIRCWRLTAASDGLADE